MPQKILDQESLVLRSGDNAPATTPRRDSGSTPAPVDVVPMLIGSTMQDVERELILQTLAHCEGNRTHAARVLGVSLRTMRNKIREYSAGGIGVTNHPLS